MARKINHIQIENIQRELSRELTQALMGFAALEAIYSAAEIGMDQHLVAEALEFVTERLYPHVRNALDHNDNIGAAMQSEPKVEAA